MKSRLLRPAPLAAAVAAVLMTLALVACGGGGDSGGVASLGGSNQGSSTTTTNSSDPEQAALDYVRCMREHGVDMPDPTSGGGIRLRVHPGEEAKVEEAQRACQSIMERAAPKLSEEQQSVMQDAALAFAKCMRGHGIDMPDPTFGKGGIIIQKNNGSRGQNPDDPKFKAALKACQPIVEEAARKAGLPPPGTAGPGLSRSGGDS